MRALLASLMTRFWGSKPALPEVDDECVELIQAADEADLARDRADMAARIRHQVLRNCVTASSWARDTLERKEVQPWPSRLPKYFREWLAGLRVVELQVLERSSAERLYNHVTYPYYSECLIPGLPKRQKLPRQILQFPKGTPLVDFAERRSGGGQKARPAGRDLSETAGYTSRGMR